MNSRFIIKEILEKHSFNNYEIVVSKDKGSKCDYNKVKTTIYINENDYKGDANSFIVAAHESSHALNYSEGVTNPFLLKTLEKIWWFFIFFVVSVILVDYFVSIDYTIQKSAVYISIALHYIATISYLLYYMRDESKTETRGLQELQKIYKNHQILSVALEDIQKESKNRLVKWIYLKVAILLIGFLIVPFFLLGALTSIKNIMKILSVVGV